MKTLSSFERSRYVKLSATQCNIQGEQNPHYKHCGHLKSRKSKVSTTSFQSIMENYTLLAYVASLFSITQIIFTGTFKISGRF
jgi:hypothetical protein